MALVALAVSDLLATLRAIVCLDKVTSGGVFISPAGLTISSNVVGQLDSAACCVTAGSKLFSSTAVILKVEIEVTIEVGVMGFGTLGSVIDVVVFDELVNVLGSAVTVFVSSTVWMTVRMIGFVVADSGSGELPSTATTEYVARF